MHCVTTINTSTYNISFSTWVSSRIWAWTWEWVGGRWTPAMFLFQSRIFWENLWSWVSLSWLALCSACHSCNSSRIRLCFSLLYSPLSTSLSAILSSEFWRCAWWLSIPCVFLKMYNSPLFFKQQKHAIMQHTRRKAATTPNEIVDLLNIS